MRASSAPPTFNTNFTKIDDRNGTRPITNVTSVRFCVLAFLVLALSTIYMLPTVRNLVSDVASKPATHDQPMYAKSERLGSRYDGGYPGLMFPEANFFDDLGDTPTVIVEMHTRESMVLYLEPGFSANYDWVESLDLHSFRFKCERAWIRGSSRCCSFNVTGYWHSGYEPLPGKLYPPTAQVASQITSYHTHTENAQQEMVNVTLISDFKRVKRIDFELLSDQQVDGEDILLVLHDLEYTVHPKEKVVFLLEPQ